MDDSDATHWSREPFLTPARVERLARGTNAIRIKTFRKTWPFEPGLQAGLEDCGCPGSRGEVRSGFRWQSRMGADPPLPPHRLRMGSGLGDKWPKGSAGLARPPAAVPG